MNLPKYISIGTLIALAIRTQPIVNGIDINIIVDRRPILLIRSDVGGPDTKAPSYKQ